MNFKSYDQTNNMIKQNVYKFITIIIQMLDKNNIFVLKGI